MVNVESCEEFGIKLANHIGAKFDQLSRIDGNPIMHFDKNDNKSTTKWNFYKKWFEAELIVPLEDNRSNYYNQTPTINPYLDRLVFKIIKYDPDIFNRSLREEKLKRIINGD